MDIENEQIENEQTAVEEIAEEIITEIEESAAVDETLAPVKTEAALVDVISELNASVNATRLELIAQQNATAELFKTLFESLKTEINELKVIKENQTLTEGISEEIKEISNKPVKRWV